MTHGMAMNAVERLLRALDHQPVDRPPVTGLMTSVTTEMMDGAGVAWPEAHHDPGLMASLAAAAWESCGIESMKLPFDMTVEAGALGAEVEFGGRDRLPQVKGHPFDEPRDLRIDETLLRKGRIPLVVEAVRRARATYGDRIPVVSSIVGPFTLSAMLFGFENLFVWMLSEPERYEAALEKVTGLCLLYARAQSLAGCHVVQVGEASSSGDLLSGDQYGRFVAPWQERLCRACPFPTVVHICGNITGHLSHVARTGMTGISFDQKTDVRKAVATLKGKVALVGYVPTALLLEGSGEDVFNRSRECIAAGVDVLNAGCAWPAEIPNRNVKAMVNAARDWGR